MRRLSIAAALRLLSASALFFFLAMAISLMTHDAWLIGAHVLGLAGAVAGGLGVLVALVARLARLGRPGGRVKPATSRS